MRDRRKAQIVLALVGALVVLAGCGGNQTSDSAGVTNASVDGNSAMSDARPMLAAGGKELERGAAIAEAKGHAFHLRMPSTSYAAEDTLVSIREDGSGIAMQFPRPTSSSDAVRQPNIEVWAGHWAGGDPEKFNAEDIAESGGALTACQVGDLDGVCVAPQSSKDVDRANPAFVRIVIGDTVYEVSGGDSLERVLGVARSIAKAPVLG